MRRNGRRRAGSESGFTLVEVMMALMIMGIGLLTIGLAQLTAMRMATTSEKRSQAMYLAQEQLEAFYAQPPLNGGTFQDPLNPIDIEPNDRDYTTFNRSWTITPNQPQAGMSTVRIIVEWNNKAGGSSALQGAKQQVVLEGVVR